jgi:aminopeptidase YwaD
VKHLSTFLFVILTPFIGLAQIDSAALYTEINKIEGIQELLQQFESFGEKSAGSDNLHDCAAWIKSEYERYGYKNVRFDTFESPLKGINYNIKTSIPSNSSGGKIIIGSHYDTKGGPGVNDNGTGVAVQMLIAQRLCGLTPNVRIEFIHFAGEEQGFHGSAHEAQLQADSGVNVDFYLNLDELGAAKGAGDNMKVICERDENNNPSANNASSDFLTRDLAWMIDSFSDVETSIDRAFSSDYEPFQSHGFTITGLYQGSKYDFTHSAGDTLGNVDTLVTLEIAKGLYAFFLLYTQVKEVLSTASMAAYEMQIFPNPATGTLHFRVPGMSNQIPFKVWSSDGKVLKQGNSKGDIDISDTPSGMYLLQLSIDNLSVIKRFVVASGH